MSDFEYKDKFIAFVDILGFKKMVTASQGGTGLALHELIEILDSMALQKEVDSLRINGFTICPTSTFFQHDLDFCLTQISDCAIISCEVSPAGIINLLYFCRMIAIRLLTRGLLCRGYVYRGQIYHHGNYILGTGYIEAYSKERSVSAFKQNPSETGTPFIELDPRIAEFVDSCSDANVKKMFERFTAKDRQLFAVYPFDAFQYSSVTGYRTEYNSDKEIETINKMREDIAFIKNKIWDYADMSDDQVMYKIKHYINALDRQLAIYDQAKENIRKLDSPFPARTLTDLIKKKGSLPFLRPR